MKTHTTTRFVILGLLTIKPMSGYDMKKFISQSINHFWSESNGQLYPTLSKLVKEGKISSREETKGKKSRSVYSILDEGLLELKSWLEHKIEKLVHRDEGLLKLFFSLNTSRESTIKRLAERKQTFLEMLQEFNTLLNMLDVYKKSPHYVFWLLSLKNGIITAKAEVEWCEEAVKILTGNNV